jgi:hypothetical protein
MYAALLSWEIPRQFLSKTLFTLTEPKLLVGEPIPIKALWIEFDKIHFIAYS